ncbi:MULTISPECIES: ATP-binding protein [Methylosinus]|uniref:histidine kinase n=1 Tax=Methylosinus trichosporium (strain ATCC 35070 / NCIMB 11131 / UNIQEM 75 / OB3b) TaxID=595536 RepID=A0A2D2CW40_METT3|nr:MULTISPECIES: ATP-binding protein [Methylosinus]ATQ66935.1 two-component sensor histidine kinase [Methylosinus trichosporium OB3b]OBS54099.1 two-component sensor histidine kinase [Methylosinus sp. 3S-1]
MTLALPAPLDAPRRLWRGVAGWLHERMPKGLYARSLLIVILPIVLLQSAVAYFFMERHWQAVTSRLSAAVARDVAALVDLYDALPEPGRQGTLQRIAGMDLNVELHFLPVEPLPPPTGKPFFSLLDHTLSRELSRRLTHPFWIDTVGRSHFVEIRVALPDTNLRILASRTYAYASNSEIFFIWTVIASLVIIAIAASFLRNQIRPILRLARAAEEFGKGREVAFSPRGAREVRQAGAAFLEMKRRVERAMEQRKTMLSGVSHDLRTIITRFKLSLALIGDSPESAEMRKDVAEMEGMVEGYLAFARGDAGESTESVDVSALLEEICAESQRLGLEAKTRFSGRPQAAVRPAAFRRCLANLVGNAQRYAKRLELSGSNDGARLVIHIDDDGPGIPDDKREDAFRPFYRLDESRNQDESHSGLGLAIARDIAYAHGGNVKLSDSPLGGLRATVSLPV